MFSSTTSAMPKAAVVPSRPSGSATSRPIAAAAASAERPIEPPAKPSGSIRPSATSASVTAGRVPPRPYEAGPGSDPALSGPTRIWRIASTCASEPPPAPISTMSITGMESGMPEPFLKR